MSREWEDRLRRADAWCCGEGVHEWEGWEIRNRRSRRDDPRKLNSSGELWICRLCHACRVIMYPFPDWAHHPVALREPTWEHVGSLPAGKEVDLPEEAPKRRFPVPGEWFNNKPTPRDMIPWRCPGTKEGVK